MKVVCVGRNYALHAKELNNAIPTTPLLFLKPETAVIIDNKPFTYPTFSKDIHYEVELVFRIGKTAKNIGVDEAINYLDGVGIGIDFTARDIQQICKEKGWPWDRAKGFDESAPVSNIRPLSAVKALDDIHFRLEKNGTIVQAGWSGDMLFPIPELLASMSRYFTLTPGDLIFTGTPSGVGPVTVGDTLEAFVEEESWLICSVQ